MVVELVRLQRLHGLRHSDYLRYQQYLSRMLRRSRRVARLPANPQARKGKANPVALLMGPLHIPHPRQIYIAVGLAERVRRLGHG